MLVHHHLVHHNVLLASWFMARANNITRRGRYYIDTPTSRVDRFDFDPATGSISNRAPVIEFPELGDDGKPFGCVGACLASPC